MPIIDSQVHAYEANTPKRPWATVPNWPPHVTGDEMVAAMDQVGVDGAIFISSFSMYRYDGSYAEEVARQNPGRMAIVKPVDPDDKNVADVIAKWKKTQGAVGIRIFLREACSFLLEALGKPFNAEFHQAMMEIEDKSVPAGTVVQELIPGYLIAGRLLRAAMVGVSKGGPAARPAVNEN